VAIPSRMTWMYACSCEWGEALDSKQAYRAITFGTVTYVRRLWRERVGGMPISRLRPALPKCVCLGPSIAASVPGGSGSDLSGTTATLVPSRNSLLKINPCLPLLITSHPASTRSFNKPLPVGGGRSAILDACGYQIGLIGIRTLENMRLKKRRRRDRGTDNFWGVRNRQSYLIGRGVPSNLDAVFLEETRTLTYRLQCIQVVSNEVVQLFLYLRQRFRERARAQFKTGSHPLAAFMLKLKSQHYVAYFFKHLPFRCQFCSLLMSDVQPDQLHDILGCQLHHCR